MSTFYTPKTDEELNKESLLDAGEYDFKVLEAEATTSQTGNPMMKVKLHVYTDGGSQHIYDYIVPSSNFGERKLKAFAKSLGLESEYNSGKLTPDLAIERSGKVTLGIQDAKDGYQARNIVAGLGYVESDGPF
jgi:hypothetical protein